MFYDILGRKNIAGECSLKIPYSTIAVKGRKSLKCGRNGQIILFGAAYEDALICCTSLLGCTVCSGVVPLAV